MPHTITGILQDWNRGELAALHRLTPHVYLELRAIAARALAGEQSNPIQPTELVHEYFLRIRGLRSPNWRDRRHFYGAAAEQMRRLLVDLARRRNAAKRVPIDISVPGALDFEALDAALRTLAALDPRQSRIVELRFFGGFSIEETADLLEISPATVKREWAIAKAWLRSRLG